ncbi:hypothetical protein LINPERHAP1_LOCUS30877 [Linum perenne]
MKFFRLVQDFSPVSPVRKKLAIGSRSFAQVVAGQKFSLLGRCSSVMVGGLEGIRVEPQGVDERLQFLAGCLVFRFWSSERVEWSSFRRWAMRSWGVELDSPIQKLGDCLWLLSFGSEEKVKRILALNRFWFGNIEILLDGWIPEAGRSRVLLEEDL